MTEKAEDQEKSTGTAINMEELDAVEQEAGAEEAPQSAGELLEEREGPTTAEVIAPLIGFGCDIGCPNWQVQKEEKRALAEGYGELIDKYYPEGLGAIGVELNALLMTAAIFGPRVAQGIPARAKPKAEEASDDKETANNED
ncbi:hypothetical protein [Marinobacter salarius]|uniref:hypothetical protein n=1 Tax=Marinobacter salarius TaxID=1420917 RepID=UPI003D10BFB1